MIDRIKRALFGTRALGLFGDPDQCAQCFRRGSYRVSEHLGMYRVSCLLCGHSYEITSRRAN